MSRVWASCATRPPSSLFMLPHLMTFHCDVVVVMAAVGVRVPLRSDVALFCSFIVKSMFCGSIIGTLFCTSTLFFHCSGVFYARIVAAYGPGWTSWTS